MAPYLPRDGGSGSPYSEGGALYALGLIHANHGQDIRDFLLESLRGTQNEVRLGCCGRIFEHMPAWHDASFVTLVFFRPGGSCCQLHTPNSKLYKPTYGGQS